ncbi:hypothetical protein CN918_31375 [Priestia megaterium]|nr:hypothetical protein CN918_31375 [Priestia megaterium]
MKITTKKENIKVTFDQDGLVMWLHVSPPEFIDWYRNSIQERMKLRVVEGWNALDKPFFRYIPTTKQFEVVVNQHMAHKLESINPNEWITYRYWYK